MRNIYWVILTALMLTSCGSSGGSSSTSTTTNNTDPQTYGGVNQAATSVYSFQNNDASTTGIIRLTNSTSGIIYIASTNSSLSFNLEGAVNSFNSNSSDCLGNTALTGNVNNEPASSISISMNNCTIESNSLNANIIITANGNTLYNESTTASTSTIISTANITALAESLATTSPALYNHNANLSTHFTIYNSTTGYNSGYTGVSGELLGNLLNNWTSTTPESFDFGSIHGQATYNMIDSSSVNITINNLATESSVWEGGVTTSSQILCNIIVSGLPSSTTDANSSMHGFITGCSGTVSSSFGNSNITLNGSLNIQ